MGYTVGKISPDMSKLVSDRWKFSEDGLTDGLIREPLEWGYPSVCIYGQDGTPVSWALQNFYGFLGHLHTEEGHRGKGIGKYVVTLLARHVLDKTENAYVAVEKSNLTSITLHEKLGFKRLSASMDFTWMVYSTNE